VIGAYLTFRIARRAGLAYLHSKFGIGSWMPFSVFFTNGAPVLLPSYRGTVSISHKRVFRGGRSFEWRYLRRMVVFPVSPHTAVE